MSPAIGTPARDDTDPYAQPHGPSATRRPPAGPRGRPAILAGLLIAVLVVVAAAYWALAVYDAGPGSIGPSAVAAVQVAGAGWVSVDSDGPARAEVDGFLMALDGARALWPPRLLFE